MSQDDTTQYPSLPAFEYGAFPQMAVAEMALAARADPNDPQPALAGDTLFYRAAARLFRFVFALIGSHTSSRRQTGVYQVVTHTERAAIALHPAARPVVSPRLATLEVLAPRTPTDPRYLTLLEVALPSRALALAGLSAPLVAARRYNSAWPEALQDAYRACVAAHGAWVAACDAEWLERSSAGYRRANTAAYCGWSSLEQHYLPLFRAWEEENGIDPQAPVTAALEAVEGHAL